MMRIIISTLAMTFQLASCISMSNSPLDGGLVHRAPRFLDSSEKRGSLSMRRQIQNKTGSRPIALYEGSVEGQVELEYVLDYAEEHPGRSSCIAALLVFIAIFGCCQPDKDHLSKEAETRLNHPGLLDPPVYLAEEGQRKFSFSGQKPTNDMAL